MSYPNESYDFRKNGTNERQVVDVYYYPNRHREIYTFEDMYEYYHEHLHIDEFGRVSRSHEADRYHTWEENQDIDRPIYYVDEFRYNYIMIDTRWLSLLSKEQLIEYKNLISQLENNTFEANNLKLKK